MHFHHCRILKKYNLLSFENFRLFLNLCLIYKILNGLAPLPLCDFVYNRSVDSVGSSRISSTQDSNTPFQCTAFGQCAFSVKTTNQWNTLPDNVKSCSSSSTFQTSWKSLLKAAQPCSHWLWYSGSQCVWEYFCTVCSALFLVNLYVVLLCALSSCLDLPRDYRCKLACSYNLVQGIKLWHLCLNYTTTTTTTTASGNYGVQAKYSGKRHFCRSWHHTCAYLVLRL